MIRRRAALAALAGVCVVGCQTAPLRPLPPDDPGPGALLARWRAAVSGREALSGTSRLSVDAPGAAADGGTLRLRSRGRLVVARPARLRVEVQDLLGTTRAVLTVSDGRYAFFRAEDRSFESGPAGEDLLRRLLRLDLRPAEAVDVLLGTPPVPDAPIETAWRAGDGAMRIALAAGDGPAPTLDLDAQGRLLRFAVPSAAGRVGFEVRYDDYAEVGGSEVAHRVSLSLGDSRAVVALGDLVLNPVLAPDIFRLGPVPGSRGSGAEGG